MLFLTEVLLINVVPLKVLLWQHKTCIRTRKSYLLILRKDELIWRTLSKNFFLRNMFDVSIISLTSFNFPWKSQKKSIKAVQCSQISFFAKGCADYFSFNLFFSCRFWYTSFTTFFVFDWNRKSFMKKVIKTKWRKAKHPFLR